MVDSLLLVSLGIVIGWNVLPQPAWAKAIYDRGLAAVRRLAAPKSE